VKIKKYHKKELRMIPIIDRVLEQTGLLKKIS